MPKVVPTLDRENEFFADGARVVVGVDEVGRGAIAGPVCVGAVAIGPAHHSVPDGLADSKLLSATRRTALVPVIRSWALACATGWVSAADIDRLGIMGALSLAASRAIAGLGIAPDIVIVDGDRSFLADDPTGPRVVTQVKADQTCASVSAASVIAKVERDDLMQSLDAEFPVYAWARNKGYGASVHTTAIREHGLTIHHRHSWNLLRD